MRKNVNAILCLTVKTSTTFINEMKAVEVLE